MQPVYKKQKEADRGGVLRSPSLVCRRRLSPPPVVVRAPLLEPQETPM